MRWFHLTVIGLFALIMLIFVVQNLEIVTLAFLGFNLNTRLAYAVVVAYILGMVTGGSLWSLLRRSIRGSRQQPEETGDVAPTA